MGEGQGLSELFGVVEQVSFCLQFFFLVFLGFEGVEFLDGVFGEVCVVGCLFGLLLCEGVVFARLACVVPLFLEARAVFGEFCEGVEEGSVGCAIEESALVELPLDVDELLSDEFEEVDGDGIVLEEGFAFGVFVDDSSYEDIFVVGEGDAVVFQDVSEGVFGVDSELCGDGGLAASFSDERGVGARAEDERERIEQHGFSCACFS